MSLETNTVYVRWEWPMNVQSLSVAQRSPYWFMQSFLISTFFWLPLLTLRSLLLNVFFLSFSGQVWLCGKPFVTKFELCGWGKRQGWWIFIIILFIFYYKLNTNSGINALSGSTFSPHVSLWQLLSSVSLSQSLQRHRCFWLTYFSATGLPMCSLSMWAVWECNMQNY